MNTRLFYSKSLLTLSLFWLALVVLNAQGFVQQYPFFPSGDGGIQSVFPQADGSFRLTSSNSPDSTINLIWLETDAYGQLIDGDTLTYADTLGFAAFLLENGSYLSAIDDSNTVTIRHFNGDNSLAWSSSVTFPDFRDVRTIAIWPNDTGEVFVRGFFWHSATGDITETGYIMKFSPTGTLLWKIEHPRALTYVWPKRLVPMPDGGCLFANYSNDSSLQGVVLRLNGDGTLLWSYSPQNGDLLAYTLDHALAVNALGESLVPIQNRDTLSGVDSLLLVKIAANGQIVDQTNVSAVVERFNLRPSLIFPTTNGWVVVAEHYILNSWVQYIFRLDAVGNTVWQKPLNFISAAFPSECTDGRELSDGSLVIYGYQQGHIFLFKLAADGTIYPHTLVGQVARDAMFDCLPNSTDPPLQNWIVTAEGSNGHTQFGATDTAGHYIIADVDTGNYRVNVVPLSYLWNACVDSVLVSFSDNMPQTDTVDFQVQPLYDCPLMQVDIGSIGLRRCFSGSYVVNYCNTGNESADSATVTVSLDPLLQMDSASIPFTQVDGVLHFALNAVDAGECGSFQVYVHVSCEADLGQTLCAEAHIFPDTICAPNLPNWSGAIIELTAACTGDSVRFALKNTGSAPTSQDLDFIVIDDHVITRQGNFHLQPAEIRYESVPADGSTWRLTAQQEPGYPFGVHMPSVAIEGCDPAGSGFSIGMLNMFPNYSGDPFHDIACQTVVGSYDPNDKQALPIGVDNQHFIEQNTPVDYQIRFQNTGTDTAFTVVVKDTLSAWLDPTTVRPGAASHPYTWTLSGAGILTFTFNNIFLPDSNVNEAASHGFVQFYIDQHKDVPLGTILENRAGIYFDFNAPVMTNTVWHTIGHDFLTTTTHEPGLALPSLHIWPNPASQSTSVWAEKPFESGQRLVLRDALGRVVREMAVQGQTTEMQRAGLPTGLYFLELRGDGRTLAVGKVVWK